MQFSTHGVTLSNFYTDLLQVIIPTYTVRMDEVLLLGVP